jgi:hypothetical protein
MHYSTARARYKYNDLSSGGSPEDCRSSSSNDDEHKDKIVSEMSAIVSDTVLDGWQCRITYCG